MKNERLVELLKKLNLTITFAESLTGGLCASKIVDISGASSVFKGSFVTYSNIAKEKLIGVNDKTIEKYGVVSKEVALEMALGAKRVMESDAAISFTGVAGPSDEGNVPAGRVCMAFILEDEIISESIDFGPLGRNNVRDEAVCYAISKMVSMLEKRVSSFVK